MNQRFRLLLPATAAAVLAFAVVLMHHDPIAAQTSADIEQGHYLVTDVAHCEGCHGTGLVGRPADPSNPRFIPRPKIAGLPMFANDADAVKFFETGLLPDGVSRARPPMPQFRFKPSDAVAVVAYLRTLKSTP
jgi:mono/diheme cytochrome c family protein